MDPWGWEASILQLRTACYSSCCDCKVIILWLWRRCGGSPSTLLAKILPPCQKPSLRAAPKPPKATGTVKPPARRRSASELLRRVQKDEPYYLPERSRRRALATKREPNRTFPKRQELVLIPKGSKYPMFRCLVPKTIPSMEFGTSNLKYWVYVDPPECVEHNERPATGQH